MPTEPDPIPGPQSRGLGSRFNAGQIVIVDWRGDALPKEPSKLRPAIVVEADGLFAPSYPNVLVVPLTEDQAFVIPDLSVAIDPTAANACPKPCWAASHMVTAISKMRVNRATASNITEAQLAAIREQIVECVASAHVAAGIGRLA